jgi:hypothetical protein
MGVFKEEASVIENVAKKQTRIYNDAADHGYPYDINNPTSDIKALIDVIKQFKALDKEFSDGSKPIIRNRQVWGTGVTLDVIIFWEQDGGIFSGTKYTISFNKTSKHPSLINKSCNGFISIDINRHSER